MVYNETDAEDATQELLVRVVTKLSTYRFESSFRTWLYRLVVNHVLNMERSRPERRMLTFSDYGRELDAAPIHDIADEDVVPADLALVVEESRISCTMGMLLCLERPQRLVYILGEIFGVTDMVGAQLLEISRENFRQRLARARSDLHSFMQDKCGLVNSANPCRCAKKTRTFIRMGYVDPQRLKFSANHVAKVRDLAPQAYRELEELDREYGAIHRAHPFLTSPDFVDAMRRMLESQSLISDKRRRQ
jgi:RNA polymerase sigma factor (sigma-70 family)